MIPQVKMRSAKNLWDLLFFNLRVRWTGPQTIQPHVLGLLETPSACASCAPQPSPKGDVGIFPVRVVCVWDLRLEFRGLLFVLVLNPFK